MDLKHKAAVLMKDFTSQMLKLIESYEDRNVSDLYDRYNVSYDLSPSDRTIKRMKSVTPDSQNVECPETPDIRDLSGSTAKSLYSENYHKIRHHYTTSNSPGPLDSKRCDWTVHETERIESMVLEKASFEDIHHAFRSSKTVPQLVHKIKNTKQKLRIR